MKRILIMIALTALIISITGCAQKEERPFSEYLERRIATALEDETVEQKRPDYLPEEMFSLLPEFPKDFYAVRQLVRVGTIKDLSILGEEYWMQPEFFPNFEEIGVPLLQNPPENRWGVSGYMAYPGDTVSTIVPGETLDIYFFIKSSYLVETYQGIMFNTLFPDSGEITTGVSLPDGSNSVAQDPEDVEKHFTVTVAPNPFVLEPNFPVFRLGGIVKVKATVTAAKDTPKGNYVIAFDIGQVPEEYEQRWLKQYLNLYVSGTMTKVGRPYHQAFIAII